MLKTPNKLKKGNKKNNKTHKNLNKLFTIKNNFGENNLSYAIRFYDNMAEMISQFKKHKKYVDSILVSNNSNKEVMNGNSNASSYTTEFLKKNPENKFAQYLLSIKNEEFESNIAFSIDDAKNLCRWASNPNIKTKAVVFDWDGTLSVLEGLILTPTKETTLEMMKKGITYLDMAIYCAGTKTRLNMLRKMFYYLHKKNVKVFILTNNPLAACNWQKLNDSEIGPYSRYNFYKVAKQFIPQLKEKNILCGYETDGFKPETFSKNPYLREVYSRIEKWHATHSSPVITSS